MLKFTGRSVCGNQMYFSVSTDKMNVVLGHCDRQPTLIKGSATIRNDRLTVSKVSTVGLRTAQADVLSLNTDRRVNNADQDLRMVQRNVKFGSGWRNGGALITVTA